MGAPSDAQSPSMSCSVYSSQDLRGRGDVTTVNESSMAFFGIWVPLDKWSLEA